MSYRNQVHRGRRSRGGQPRPGILVPGQAHPQRVGAPARRSAPGAHHHPGDVGGDPGDIDQARTSEGRGSTPLNPARHHRTVGRRFRFGRSVPDMGAIDSAEAVGDADDQSGVAALIPTVRRIVYSRVADTSMAEDLVQETLVKVLGAAPRVEQGMLEPYAIVTARNVVASMWKEQDRHRRNRHRVVDLSPAEAPDEDLLKREEGDAVSAALARLSERERQTLLAHEVSGQDTRSLGEDLGHDGRRSRRAAEPQPRSTPGGVPPGPPGCRAPDRQLSSGPVRLVRRRPATTAGGGCGPAPPRVRPLRRAEPSADGPPAAERGRGAGPHQGRRRHRACASGVPASWRPAWGSPRRIRR